LSTWKLTTLANTSFRRIGVEEVSFGIRKITGNVRDVSGEPLIFANVYVDGHNLGTQTELDGNFSILMPEGANALNVASTGYTTQTIPVTKDYLDITLSGGNSLDEVVVTGLRTARSSADISYSGSMSRVSRASREIKMPEQITVIENEISVEFELK
jgi:iron complex outermembrane receptor protein